MKPHAGREAKALRRAEAEARLAHWQSLSYEQQLVELSNRPGVSAKQVARIKHLIAVRDNL